MLKWPNDLVVDSGKLGGILVEIKTVESKLAFAIVGIGINVNQSKESLPAGAVSIQTSTGQTSDLRSLSTRVIKEMKPRYAELENPTVLVSEWWDRCSHKLKTVRVEGQEVSIVGRNTGISESGQLIVDTRDRRQLHIDEGTLTVL